MQDTGVALGRTEPSIPHASICSFEGVVPKSADWRSVGVADDARQATAAE
jgi:hypothetical protein